MSALLTGNLPLIADAPEGIRTLRGLILELAVRGKLVPQDAKDEPAEALLERIALEKARVSPGRGGKRQQSTRSATTEDQPFVLPAGWVWTRLGEIALINPRNAADDSTVVSFVPMAMIGTRFEGTHEQELRTWAEVKQGFTHFAEDDVGVAKITPCFENSKACVFSGLSNGIGAGTTELHIVRPIASTLAPRYVLAYLKAPIFLHVGESRMTGTAGQKRLPKDFLEQNPFPLPPLAEQHRIVAKVDELMALCDRLEAEQKDAEAVHARLVDALLAALTRSTDAADFAANWQRLAAHFDTLFTTEASINVLKLALIQLAYAGALTHLKASTWPAARLADVTLTIADIDHKMPRSVPQGIIFLSAKDLKDDGTLDFSHPKYISQDDFDRLSRRICPRRGDIIYSRIGARLGKARLVEVDTKFLVSYSCCVIRPDTRIVNVHYLVRFLDSKLALNQAHLGKQSIGVPDLGLGVIKQFLMPLPPLAEQHRIVAKVDELMALCDRLKADLAFARENRARLADALVHTAFQAA
ncbi:MAG: restriction endonuclease subunit S [Methyloversatilis discipulorum]|uniref:restriction endonuclease subunit S n=1 Tax=Methyloversatilis discipulorum TaxID=1119528 RepID=UPI0026F280BE|nr:restriction endonuclease subunit S [Methyloversatilis discipulorum]MBV5285799.1 restriction endonuclease subunit S [Methyloversatilis discipulorum]